MNTTLTEKNRNTKHTAVDGYKNSGKQVEVLVATMNRTGYKKLIHNMKVTGCGVVINQITRQNLSPTPDYNSDIIFKTFHEKGLSRSRNRALQAASCEICVIADDDMYYEDNYQAIIQKAYSKYPDADIIAFFVGNEDAKRQKKKRHEGRVGFFGSFRISSWQITFRRNSIIQKGIKFDELFGTGSEYFFGEENIFLADCLRAGLRIYYVPWKIATLIASTESTWDHSHTARRYEVQGAVFYRMSPFWFLLSITQFTIRKRNLYRDNLSMSQAFISMLRGAKEYAKHNKQGR